MNDKYCACAGTLSFNIRLNVKLCNQVPIVISKGNQELEFAAGMALPITVSYQNDRTTDHYTLKPDFWGSLA